MEAVTKVEEEEEDQTTCDGFIFFASKVPFATSNLSSLGMPFAQSAYWTDPLRFRDEEKEGRSSNADQNHDKDHKRSDKSSKSHKRSSDRTKVEKPIIKADKSEKKSKSSSSTPQKRKGKEESRKEKSNHDDEGENGTAFLNEDEGYKPSHKKSRPMTEEEEEEEILWLLASDGEAPEEPDEAFVTSNEVKSQKKKKEKPKKLRQDIPFKQKKKATIEDSIIQVLIMENTPLHVADIHQKIRELRLKGSASPTLNEQLRVIEVSATKSRRIVRTGPGTYDLMNREEELKNMEGDEGSPRVTEKSKKRH
eukprot:TRINITY_DN4254_c0_g1_i1.p1 TRINITY_DN4254_c0_g1~~TRINITY_DN4254_c0_g1_i1.p1  ORF type:complete len:308 (+),score=85.82 TRINITY_DN4254_c0_g1_i1:160-1083(+)